MADKLKNIPTFTGGDSCLNRKVIIEEYPVSL